MSESSDIELREEQLAASYLSQATQAFFNASRPQVLFRSTGSESDQPARRYLIRRMMAASRQVELARMSILFSTLAAEAYANQFLSEHLDARDAEAVDRLPFNDKLMLAPQLALGQRLFDRGEEPMQSIDRLHRLRRHLVHPRPRAVEVKRGHLYERPGSSDYNPKEAAKALVAVANVAVRLSEVPDAPSRADPTAQHLHASATEILEIADEAAKIPKRGSPLKRLRRKRLPDAEVKLPRIPLVRLPDRPEEDEAANS